MPNVSNLFKTIGDKIRAERPNSSWPNSLSVNSKQPHPCHRGYCLVPKGSLRIARHFNAGTERAKQFESRRDG